MSYGFIAQNTHGVLISSLQKSYVFSQYIPAGTPTAGVYSFRCTGVWANLYGIRLGMGGQGSLLSVVYESGAFTVNVLGSGVLGILVFSPVVSAQRGAYSLTLFDHAGECTFDSSQKPLVVTHSAQLLPTNLLSTSGDVVFYMGTAMYPSSTTTVTTQQTHSGYSLRYYSQYYRVMMGTRVTYTATTTEWNIDRNVAQRTSTGILGAKQFHVSGEYTFATDFQRLQTDPRYRQNNIDVWRKVDHFQPYDTLSIDLEIALTDSIEKEKERIRTANRFPYANQPYNTSQQLVLVTDSSNYL